MTREERPWRRRVCVQPTVRWYNVADRLVLRVCGGPKWGRGPRGSTVRTIDKAAAASRRAPVLLLVLAGLLAGCAEENKGIKHPHDRLHFPVTLAADPNGDYIYVVNSNFDVRYRTGSVVAIDLDTHDFVLESPIGVGGFGGDLRLYETGGDPRLVGYVTSRSTGALFWFEVTDENQDGRPELKCRAEDRDGAPGLQECSSAYAVTRAARPRLPRDDEGLTEEEVDAFRGSAVGMGLGVDVFGLTVVPGSGGTGDYLLASNPRYDSVGLFRLTAGTPLAEGYLTLPAFDANTPVLPSAPGHPVFLESYTLIGGSFGAAVAPATGAGTDPPLVYLFGKYTNVLLPVLIRDIPDPNGADRLWPSLEVQRPLVIDVASSRREFSLEMAFRADGQRAYLAYRSPPSLVVVDTSPQDDGAPRDRALGAVDVGEGASSVVVARTGPERTHPDGTVQREERVYVVCFDDEVVYVVNPETLVVEDLIEVPGGPFDLAIVDAPAKNRLRGYITVFERDAVAVIELDRMSPFFHEVVAYIRGDG